MSFENFYIDRRDNRCDQRWLNAYIKLHNIIISSELYRLTGIGISYAFNNKYILYACTTLFVCVCVYNIIMQ